MDYSVCLCLNLIEACGWYNPSILIANYPTFYLVMSFISCVPFQDACYHRLLRGTLFSPSVCWNLSYTFLDLLQGHTLDSNKDILLTSTRNHSQGNTVLPTAQTPTPNGLRSSWEFIPGDPLTCWQVQHHQHFEHQKEGEMTS